MGMGHMGTGTFGAGAFGAGPMGLEPSGQAFHANGGDALEVYFECITTCSLDDGACVTRCVEQLRENP